MIHSKLDYFKAYLDDIYKLGSCKSFLPVKVSSLLCAQFLVLEKTKTESQDDVNAIFLNLFLLDGECIVISIVTQPLPEYKLNRYPGKWSTLTIFFYTRTSKHHKIAKNHS